jgi:hypothetical protein
MVVVLIRRRRKNTVRELNQSEDNMLLKEVRVLTDLQVISESRDTGVMCIRGTFQRAEEENHNKRVYPKAVLESCVKSLQEKLNGRELVGELDHPADGVVKLQNASHLITKLEWKGNDLIGEAEILPTPAGQIAKSLINAGVKIGISSRGMGTLSEASEGSKIVNPDYKMITFDLVADPSTKGAYPSLAESKQHALDFVENVIKPAISERAFVARLKKQLNLMEVNRSALLGRLGKELEAQDDNDTASIMRGGKEEVKPPLTKQQKEHPAVIDSRKKSPKFMKLRKRTRAERIARLMSRVAGPDGKTPGKKLSPRQEAKEMLQAAINEMCGPKKHGRNNNMKSKTKILRKNIRRESKTPLTLSKLNEGLATFATRAGTGLLNRVANKNMLQRAGGHLGSAAGKVAGGVVGGLGGALIGRGRQGMQAGARWGGTAGRGLGQAVGGIADSGAKVAAEELGTPANNAAKRVDRYVGDKMYGAAGRLKDAVNRGIARFAGPAKPRVS